MSTVTGRPATDRDFTAEYWGRNLREPVRFAAAVGTLTGIGNATFVELGPHPVLGGAIARTLEAHGQAGLALASLRRGHPADAAMLTLAGRLWQRGHDVSWSALYPGKRRWVALPSTPWQRESHPARVGSPAAGLAAGQVTAAPGGGHPLLARRLATAQPTYETRLDREAPAYLADHRIEGVAILPATALVEMALHAGADALGFARTRLDELVIRRPLPLGDGRVVQLTVSSEAADLGELRVFSRSAGDGREPWVLHATARLRADDTEGQAPAPEAVEALKMRARTVRARDAHYERFQALGADFGPAFRGVRRIWCNEDEALAEVELPSMLDGADPGTRLHPALLDACVQVVAGAVDTTDGALLVPMAADAVRVGGWATRAWSHARLRVQGDGVTADIVVTDDRGELLAELRGLVFRRAMRESAPAVAAGLYELVWQASPPAVPNGTSGSKRWLIAADGASRGRRPRRAAAVARPRRHVAPGRRVPATDAGGVVDRRRRSARLAMPRRRARWARRRWTRRPPRSRSCRRSNT